MGLFNKNDNNDLTAPEEVDSATAAWNERVVRQSRGELKPEDVLGFRDEPKPVENIQMEIDDPDRVFSSKPGEMPIEEPEAPVSSEDTEKTQVIDLPEIPMETEPEPIVMPAEEEKEETAAPAKPEAPAEPAIEVDDQEKPAAEPIPPVEAEEGPVLPPVTRPKADDAFADFFRQLDAEVSTKKTVDDDDWARLLNSTEKPKTVKAPVAEKPVEEPAEEPVAEEPTIIMPAVKVPVAEPIPEKPVIEKEPEKEPVPEKPKAEAKPVENIPMEPEKDNTAPAPVKEEKEPVASPAPGALYGTRHTIDRSAIDDFFNDTEEEEEPPRFFLRRRRKDKGEELQSPVEAAVEQAQENEPTDEEDVTPVLSRREARRAKRAAALAAAAATSSGDEAEAEPMPEDGTPMPGTVYEEENESVSSRREARRQKRAAKKAARSEEAVEENEEDPFELPGNAAVAPLDQDDFVIPGEQENKAEPVETPVEEAVEALVETPAEDKEETPDLAAIFSAIGTASEKEPEETADEPLFDTPTAPVEQKPELFPEAPAEEADPEDFPDEPDDDTFNLPAYTEDYENIGNAAGIKEELITRKKRLTVRAVLTALLTVAMLFVNGYFFESQGVDLQELPAICNLVLLSITMLVNYRSFSGLFAGDLDSDFCSCAVTGVILIQSIVSIVFFGGVGAGLGVVAGLMFLVSLLAKRSICRATLKGLCVIATSEPKQILSTSVDTALTSDAVDGDACVCYGKHAVNLHGFLKNWYSRTPADDRAARFVIGGLIAGVVMAVLALLVMKCSAGEAIAAAVLAFSAVCAPTYFLPDTLPVKLMVDGLEDYDATVSGFRGAKKLAESNVMALSSADLFPAGSLILHNMTPLSANTVDQSILKAAALAFKGNSPLAEIFADILRDDLHDLPAVEHIKYESKLGLSGWVGDEHVLIGTRVLLENHSIKTPSPEYDRKILAAGYKPVYLAIAGKPCLLFVVQYSADASVKYELQRLCNTGAVLTVDTTDANITKKLLCDCFDLSDDEVFLMAPAAAGKLAQAAEFRENAEGCGVAKRNSCGLIAALSSAIRLQSVHAAMQIVRILGIVAGLAVLFFLLFSRGFCATVLILMLLFEIVFLCLETVIPYLRRP